MKKSAPAYAVVDLRLDDGNGLEVIEALHNARPDARVVVLTGYGNIATAVTAVKLGAIDYLAKPADADDVIDALSRPRQLQPPPPENPMSADRVRWEHIQRVYELCNRNVSETARRLNMHRRTLQRILAKRAPRRNGEPTPEEILFQGAWVGNAVKPERSRSGETQHDCFAASGGSSLSPCRVPVCPPAIGNHQPRLARHDLGWHLRSYCKIQPVAEPFIFGPFVVGSEIGEARFDFNDPDFSARPDRHHIDPSS